MDNNEKGNDAEILISILPEKLIKIIKQHKNLPELFEVVMDVGRKPEARFRGDRIFQLDDEDIKYEDIDYVISRTGMFSADNRAGMQGTLHRISAIRNRQGKIIGLTMRCGRAIQGTIEIIRDFIEDRKSILIMGPPGTGKTTKLRELSRVLSDDYGRRVVIVDTSNEIGGDGDIPHNGIGSARRMQVAHPNQQHAVMIEAVENHMPEVVVVDEIGTEAEAAAARTIAERGVQLIATAHGRKLENLIKNPTLSDLVGGIQSVTLGDEEAKRRGTQKAILERKQMPTFDIVIEIQDMNTLAVYKDAAETVDRLLLGRELRPEIRAIDNEGKIEITKPKVEEKPKKDENLEQKDLHALVNIYPYGVDRSKLERAINTMGVNGKVVNHLEEAHVAVATKIQARKDAKFVDKAADRNIPLHVVRANSSSQISKFLRYVFNISGKNEEIDEDITSEIDSVIRKVIKSKEAMDVSPADATTRRIQHSYAAKKGYYSESVGDEPERFVRIFPERSR